MAMSSQARGAARKAAFRRILRWSARTGIVAAAALAVWGSIEIRARVRSDPRFDLTQQKLLIGQLPGWAPEEMRAELENLRIGGNDEEPITIFTSKVLEKIRNQVLQCAWVRDVPQIRLRIPGVGSGAGTAGSMASDMGGSSPGPSVGFEDPGGRIDLELDLRVPIAAVEAGGAFYMTDREGICMGPELRLDRVKELKLPRISGGEDRRPRRPPLPGDVWEDRDVREGLEVARILFREGILEMFPSIPVELIDISNVASRARPGECEISLRAGPLRLGWGRSPISSGARPLPPAEIVRHLKWILAHPERFQHLDMVLLYTEPMVGIPRGMARP